MSRRRKQDKKTVRRTGATVLRAVPEACDCPACSGDVDPSRVFSELLESVETLAESGDVLDAELTGATFVAMAAGGEDFVSALVQGSIPQIEAESSRAGLALLLAIGSVATDRQEHLAEVASAAAGRLTAAGIAKPVWADELAQPVRVGDCMRLSYSRATASILVASFERAGSRHAFMIMVDEEDCGAASGILVVDVEHLPEALDTLRESRPPGVEIRTQVLDPAEARWYIEEALDARTLHDEQLPIDPALDPADGDEGQPPYPVLAQLVRARLAALPPARRPAGARPHAHGSDPATLLESLESIVAAGGRAGGGFGIPSFGRPVPAKLPAKRKKSTGPAPVYQIKVGLRGAKPPIWRRLLVPADLGLASLHDVIQAAFGWQDYHMHMFETPYGEFGHADRELGHRAEAPVTLEQVAPQVKDKIRYTYDFGDDWVHEIVVEKVLDRDPALAYPRCTGGRRAAPPEDCGGIWGYEELLEVLANPRHPDHGERLEWLGLDDASQFDPAAFDVDEVNQALANLRR